MTKNSNHAIMSAVGLGLVILAAGMVGCTKYDTGTKFTTQQRVGQGLVVILPGIEGESGANHNIRRGLFDADIPYALVIYRWGALVPGPGGMLINQTNVSRNRNEGKELAEEIALYQTKYPNRPIFLIGHSGGGGIAVFALESLGQIPGAKPVTGAFLLSASISADYNLSAALRMTQRGLVNVYNPEDSLLKGTATFGNMDGGRGTSAGRTGFQRKYPKVFERRITGREAGVSDSAHFVATNAKLIAERAPAWLLSDSWPPANLPTGAVGH
jgi:pimeloyl-ACP methyl ester carboxylesterase